LQPVRPVPRGTRASGQAHRGVERGEELIGHAARPVTRDRTRPVAMGALWTVTGRCHCRVRSLPRARPIDASRARSAVQSACPVVAFDCWRAVTVGGSGDHDCFWEDTWTAQGDRTRCNTSGQFDRRVRSSRKTPSERVQRLFWWRGL
jgi:hypothetical protein